MKALILAAGKGERFYPFNHYHAKAMFPLCNRPIIERVIRRIVQAGIDDIGIVVGHRGGSIRAHLDDGSLFGCSITYVDQPEPLGTAHAVSCARPYINTDDVIVVPGDCWFDDDVLPAALEAFDRSTGAGVAVTANVDHISEHVRAGVGDDGQLVDAVWKPRGHAGTAVAGIYVFRNAAIDRLENVPDVLRAQFGISPPTGKELHAAIKVYHQAGTPLLAAASPSPVYDIDYPWHPDTIGDVVAEREGRDLTESRIDPSARIDTDARISGPVSVGPNTVIERDAYIEGPSWIGADTRIVEGSHISRHSVIGNQCLIGPYAKVNGFVGNDCRITYLGEFTGTMCDGGRVTHQIQLSGVFGLGAEIGAGTQTGTLRFDDAPIEVEVNGQRKVARGFSGVLFGDYARTGVGAMMMPGRIIGPGAMVGAGVVLMKNVPPHMALLLKQETELVDWPQQIYDR
jgi:NDP-sugar pyrophosphorylase family protein